MPNVDKDELIKRFIGFPLFCQYIVPSLQQRIKRDDWFENRFLRDCIRNMNWVEKHEALFKDAALNTVSNSDRIFSELNGDDKNYDSKFFDTLAEVRLLAWARTQGYDKIEKLLPSSAPTPEFEMRREDKVTIAEAKHFQVRDYLPDFIYDRICGIYYSKGIYDSGFGIQIDSTERYIEQRDSILKEERSTYLEKARDEMPEDILDGFDGLVSKDILDGLFTIQKTLFIGCHRNTMFGLDPICTTSLMLSKLQDKVFVALGQIAAYIGNHADSFVTDVIVFLGGTSPQEIEWDCMWKTLTQSPPNRDAWEKVRQMKEEADIITSLPFYSS